ncbi:MAG: hypothetical protein ACRC5T_04145, partial [Cetobacterium sp.]
NMRTTLTSAINISKGKEIKLNYEELKNRMRYEDVFFETILMPAFKDLGITHRFNGEFIIIKRKGDKK